MSGNNPARAIDGVDPWETIAIDPATQLLAEQAAAAAGLSLEAWLERAIRRACPTAVSTSPIIVVPNAASLPGKAEAPQSEAQDIEAATVDTSAAEHADLAFLAPPSDTAENEEAEEHLPVPVEATTSRRWAVMGLGVALAIIAGVVSAQYLIPDRPSTIRVALAPTTPTNTPSPPPPAPVVAPAETRMNEYTPSTAADLPQATAPIVAPTIAVPPPAPASGTAPSAVASLPAAPETPAPSPAATSPSPEPAPAPTKKPAAAKPPVPPAPGAKTQDKTTKSENAEPPSDPQQLAPWLEARAKSGDATAQYRLGVLYALGDGVTQDYQRAAALFKTAAEEGVTEAEYNIAVMYAEGLGIGRDPNKAVFWYRKAAGQGSASAAFNLGVAYSNGIGVPQSMEQAAQWFRRAAESGVVNAQFNIGLLYERGDGVPPSQIEAYAWYSAAAARGDAGATQRRDRLASTLSPAILKEAQARAEQMQASLPPGNASGAAPTANIPPRKP